MYPYLQHRATTYSMYIASEKELGGGGSKGNPMLSIGTIAILMHRGIGIKFEVAAAGGYYTFIPKSMVLDRKSDGTYIVQEKAFLKKAILETLYHFGQLMCLATAFGSGKLNESYLDKLSDILETFAGSIRNKLGIQINLDKPFKDAAVRRVVEGYKDRWDAKSTAVATGVKALGRTIFGSADTESWDYLDTSGNYKE